MMIDIPTALTEDETKKLREICANKEVLEIGALLGYSTVAIAQVAKEVISIDPHEGYPANDPKPTWNTYLDNLVRYEVFDKVIPIRTRWQNVCKEMVFYYYDVVFMDLTGEYEDTLECLMHFKPEFGWKLKTICVHDCGHPDWPGVMKAVNEFRGILGDDCSYAQVDNLGIFKWRS